MITASVEEYLAASTTTAAFRRVLLVDAQQDGYKSISRFTRAIRADASPRCTAEAIIDEACESPTVMFWTDERGVIKHLLPVAHNNYEGYPFDHDTYIVVDSIRREIVVNRVRYYFMDVPIGPMRVCSCCS